MKDEIPNRSVGDLHFSLFPLDSIVAIGTLMEINQAGKLNVSDERMSIDRVRLYHDVHQKDGR